MRTWNYSQLYRPLVIAIAHIHETEEQFATVQENNLKYLVYET